MPTEWDGCTGASCYKNSGVGHTTLQRFAAMKAIHIAFLCLVFVGSEAKVIQKCELYNMLKEMGVKDYFGFDVQHREFSLHNICYMVWIDLRPI